MRISFEIDDSLVARLLAEQDIDSAALTEAGLTAQEAATLIARAAIDVLSGKAAENAPISIDREALSRELGLVAAAQRPLAVDLETRGQPKAIWTPDGRWVSLDDAPEHYVELEEHLASLYDLLATNPELRMLVSRRLLPDNTETQEVFFAELDDSLAVRVRLAESPYRFRIAAAGTIVIGSPEAAPERIREGR